ncbi:hypothetical protein [Borreliella garinii]|uniref:hypothetical protein n=1 Tax=Borreliella garinii TaxID=29519 RepID=UPI001AEF579D|nr:hypothetical protein [Borreliella garinii]
MFNQFNDNFLLGLVDAFFIVINKDYNLAIIISSLIFILLKIFLLKNNKNMSTSKESISV